MARRRASGPRIVSAGAAVVVVTGAACAGLSGLTGGELPPDSGAQLEDVAPTPDAGDTCPVGYRDCDRDPTNGCETKVTESTSHCGFCGNVCSATANGYPVCVDGACRAACNTGFDNCDGNDANGCEQNVTADALNCGACGHACVGPCSAGLCTPTTISTSLDKPDALAVGNVVTVQGTTYHQVYFRAAPSTLYRVGINSGSPVAIDDATGMTLPRVVVDAGRVYFYATPDLAWCNEPCTTTPARLVTRRALPQVVGDFSLRDAIRGYSTSSYFIPGVGGGATIVGFDKASLGPSDAAVAATPVAALGPTLVSVTDDEHSVYVGTGQSGATLTGIYRASKEAGSGQMPELIVDAAIAQGGLTFGADRLFFLSDGTLYGCVASACATTTKAYGAASAGHGVANDGQFVYWAEPGTPDQAFQDGRILRCPLTGCVGKPTVFAIGQHRPSGIALTATDVYWTIRGNETATSGSILRLMK